MKRYTLNAISVKYGRTVVTENDLHLIFIEKKTMHSLQTDPYLNFIKKKMVPSHYNLYLSESDLHQLTNVCIGSRESSECVSILIYVATNMTQQNISEDTYIYRIAMCTCGSIFLK